MERDILQLCRELDRNIIAGSGADVNTGAEDKGFVLDVSVSMPRIAVCISTLDSDSLSMDPPTTPSSRSRAAFAGTPPRRHRVPRRPGRSPSRRKSAGVETQEASTLFTLALYGMNTSFTKDERQDKTMHLRLGSVSMFGVNGTNILTCGSSETDQWLQGSEGAEYAIDSSVQWRGQAIAGMDSSDSWRGGNGSNSDSEVEYDGEGISEMEALTNLIVGSKTHCIVVLSVSSVKVRWDEPTHMLFHRISSDLTSKFLYLDTPKLYVNQKALCAQLSINKSALMDLQSRSKYSAEISVQGIVFECPCLEPLGSAPVPLSGRLDAGKKMHFIRLLVRSFKICGGDFLPKVEPYSKLEEEIHRIPARSLWPSVDYLTKVLLGKLNCSVVHPFVYSLNSIEFQFVTVWGSSLGNNGCVSGMPEEVVAITASPWSLSCVVSPCDILAHPIFPALRLDIFCSPLKLALTTEVTPLFCCYIFIIYLTICCLFFSF